MTKPPPPPRISTPKLASKSGHRSSCPGEIGVFAMRRFAKDAVIVPAAQFADVRLLEWAVFETLDAVTKRKLMGYCPGTPEGLLTQPDLR
jgi:hypothetical protein